jgi:hypothetical protein
MTLLLFWRSSCGFCHSILEKIRAWEQSPPPGAARLIIVSIGDFEEARLLPFQSSVVVDPVSRVAAAFDIAGTPMGVLLNKHGILVARAGGAPNVLDLLGAQPDKSLATPA